MGARLGGGCNYHDNEVQTGVDVAMAFGFAHGLPAPDIFIRCYRDTVPGSGLRHLFERSGVGGGCSTFPPVRLQRRFAIGASVLALAVVSLSV